MTAIRSAAVIAFLFELASRVIEVVMVLGDHGSPVWCVAVILCGLCVAAVGGQLFRIWSLADDEEDRLNREWRGNRWGRS